MRRSSTLSSSSSTYATSEAPSPVAPIGDLALFQRNLRAIETATANLRANDTATARLQQVGAHLLPSPYSSPEPSSRVTRRVVEKSKAKAKVRSIRGVQAYSEEQHIHKDDSRDYDSPEENETNYGSFAMTPGFIKKMREQESRKELSWSLTGLMNVILKVNPNAENECVTRTGARGLRRLKNNNIDRDIEEAGFTPLLWNKDQTVDVGARMLEEFFEIMDEQVRAHEKAGRWEEAQNLVDRRRTMATYFNHPYQSVWEAIPGLRDSMTQRALMKRRKARH